jgi:hypothetical protein
MTPEEITHEAEGLNLLVEEADLPFESYLRTLKEDARVFDYHERVLLWLENKEEALKGEKYIGLAPHLQDFIWKIHAFSPLVDAFIDTKFCRKMEWLNPKSGVKEPLYRILGSIKNEAGVEILGTFDFCFNEDESYCYHRCFKKRAEGERLSLLLGNPRVDYDFDYPALNKDLSKKNEGLVKIDGLALRIHLDGSISFFDEITRLTIRLIPID